jgi:hypothetical protein
MWYLGSDFKVGNFVDVRKRERVGCSVRWGSLVPRLEIVCMWNLSLRQETQVLWAWSDRY